MHKYRHNGFWPDSESESDHTTTTQRNKPKEVREDLQSASEDSIEDSANEKESSRERCRTVGEAIESQKRKVGRPKKVIRIPYGRRGKPKHEEKSACNTEDNSEMKINFVEIIEPRDLNEALTSPQATKWRRVMRDEKKPRKPRNLGNSRITIKQTMHRL